jgi:hypothetical protein
MNCIRQKKWIFPDIAIVRDQDNYNIFNSRNLLSLVKDFLIKKHINFTLPTKSLNYDY